MTQKTPLNIAILGAGGIAAIHAQSFSMFPERCRVSAICDLFPDKARKLSDDYGLNARIYQDIDSLLAAEAIDAVSICLPPETHCETTVKLLKAGKHVLCEKPMAASLEECDRMIEAQRQSGKLLSVVCQNRFKSPMQKVKAMLDSGAAGKLLFATANSIWWRGENYYDLWWRGTWEKEGGGCITSHAVHHIDLMLWMMGMPRQVTAVIANVGHHNSECEDLGVAILEYEDKLAQLNCSLVSHGEEQKLIFQCEKGRLALPWSPVVNQALPNGFPEADEAGTQALDSHYQALPSLDLEDHPAQLLNFLKAIAGEEPLLIDGPEGRKAIELIAAIYQAAVTRSPVPLPMDKASPWYTKAGIVSHMPRFHQKTKSVDNFSTSTITLSRDMGK